MSGSLKMHRSRKAEEQTVPTLQGSRYTSPEISSEFQVLSRFLPHIYMTAINLGTMSLTFVAWTFYSLGDS